MEDLDLDELDQAVNKIMEKPKRKAHKKEASFVSVATAPTDPPVADPEPPASVEPSTPAPRQESSPVTAIPVSRPMPKVPVRHRTHPGAMDIIQPSSSPKMAPPSSAPSRSGHDIAPSRPVTPEPPSPRVASEPAKPRTPEQETTDIADEVLASLTMQDQPAAHTPVSTPKPEPAKKEDGNNWPDPLDFHDFADKPKEEPKAEEPAEPKESAPSMASTKPDADELLLDENSKTPFLTTKVEKRPLGAYADQTPAPEPPKEETPSRPEMAAASIQSNQHEAKPDDEADMNSLRNMSIPQQYHTAPKEQNEEVHNLFDTKEYHAAPQQMATAKKGGSPWVILLVIVLAVLAVAAIAVGYFMATGSFDLTKIW